MSRASIDLLQGKTRGTCRLCLAKGVELCDSHIMPKWVYKPVRATEPGANPNPITVGEGKAVQVSNQITEYMLCRSCEDRFENSEKYVSQIAYNERAPVLLDRLGVFGTGRLSVIVPEGALDTGLLTYFGASMFWRTGASRRQDLQKPDLGKRYGEELRQYLNGKTAFPANARISLAAIAREDLEYSLLASLPASSKIGPFRRHAFFLCGLHFMLVVGGQLQGVWDQMCLHHSTVKRIEVVPFTKLGVLMSLVPIVHTAELKGRLREGA